MLLHLLYTHFNSIALRSISHFRFSLLQLFVLMCVRRSRLLRQVSVHLNLCCYAGLLLGDRIMHCTMIVCLSVTAEA